MLNLDPGPLGALAVALRATRTKEVEVEAAATRRLIAALPAFARDPAAALTRMGFSAPVRERVLAALGADRPEPVR